LRRLLLPFQAAQQHLLPIRPAETMLAQPHLPAGASLAIWPDQETTNKSRLAS